MGRDRNRAGRKTWGELLFEGFLAVCALISLSATVGIVLVMILEAWPFFEEVSPLEFLFGLEWTPGFARERYGILPLLFGTFMVTTIALSTALVPGLIIAIYLSEFAADRWRRLLKPALELLAAIPTVVYGYFALLFLTPLLKQLIPGLSTFNALSPGLMIGVMILPLVTSLCEDAFHRVPLGYREAAVALGSSRLQTSFRVVLPAAAPGVAAACTLALARAIGETMIVSIAAGQLARIGWSPLEPVQTMTAFLIQSIQGDVSGGSLEYHTIFALGGTLFLLIFLLNVLTHRLERRFVRLR